MKIFGLAGWSGSGKTTLMEGLLRHLVGLGYRVSTLKHTHHGIDLDSPGKDTFRHRQAGATEVVLLSASRWVVMHELRNGEGEPRPEDLARRLTPVDLLLVEGFKSIRHPKIEIHRPELGKPLLCWQDQTVVGVATTGRLADLAVPCFALDDVAGIAWFIINHCCLDVGRGDA
jgi:molybdopterin-guanine dinucleotide biosynthesis protein B